MKSTKQKSESSFSSESLGKCLESLRFSIQKKNALGSIIQNWETIAGKQLASNCNPLQLNRGILIIGASHPQWRQALIYNRLALISSLQKAGFKIKDIRIQQYYPQKNINLKSDEKDIWENHPSRMDIHGIVTCKTCGNPCPAGELKLWNKCGFCRRLDFS